MGATRKLHCQIWVNRPELGVKVKTWESIILKYLFTFEHAMSQRPDNACQGQYHEDYLMDHLFSTFMTAMFFLFLS